MPIIHGQNGQHAQDLERRGLFTGLSDDSHVVIVPIDATRRLISQILKNGTADPVDIVSCAGVMSTAPNGVHGTHFLFGPGADTNLSVATAGIMSNPGKKMLDNADKIGIRIIETTREEHDAKMAIIQGLSHFFLILIGGMGDNQVKQSLITPWIAPEGTIQDMIFQNGPAEPIITEFFDTLHGNQYDPFKTFQAIVEKHLTESDMSRFSTPNFRRIMEFIRKGDVQFRLNKPYVNNFRGNLNTMGMRYIGKRIQEIRQVPMA